jgi:hypothetical protein
VQALEVAAHLERCDACQGLVAEFQSVSRRLGEWRVEAAPADLFQKLLPEFEPRIAAPRKRFGGFVRWALVASCAGVVLWLAFAMKPPSGIHKAKSVTIMNVPVMEEYARLEPTAPPADGPKIVRTAELTLTATNFDNVRGDIERVLSAYQGHVAELDIHTPTGQPRSLNATLRVEATQLDAALAGLRKLGHVEGESQRGEEVTQRYVDIEARLANARHTEQRLTRILEERTGKLSDVLAVEEQLDRVRGQIETTEAEQKALVNQIALATIQLRVGEEYRQPLTAANNGALTRLRNAGVEGLRNVTDGVFAFLIWLLSAGPSLLLIAALLFFPARWVWKRARAR